MYVASACGRTMRLRVSELERTKKAIKNVRLHLDRDNGHSSLLMVCSGDLNEKEQVFPPSCHNAS